MRSWYALAISPLLLLGCPAKESSSTTGAEAGSTAPAASSAATGLAPQTTLAPLSDTPPATATGATGTGPAAATGALSPKPKASAAGSAAGAALAGNTNAARIKQCCDALRKTTATLAPASTEAQTVTQAATLCDGVAAAVTGPATVGQAPEFAPVRQLLQGIQGKSIPAVCQGL